MTPGASNKTCTPTPEPRRTRHVARGPVPAMRFTPGPATVAVASMLCLLLGLLYLAIQIRTVFSDQLKQEYASLVLDAAARAESAREQLGVWQHMPKGGATQAQDYQRARAEFTQRLASLAALVNASPAQAPHFAPAMLTPDASLADTDAMLAEVSAYWRAQRDADGADVRVRITHVARTLIALAALLFCMLITALAMYAKRNRLLAGQSHEFEHASLHDWLTGLPNRRKLLAALEEAAASARAATPARSIAVLYVDLDGFKQVNDSLGHHAGDEFLIAVSICFRESMREAELVARIGGDEFAVLVSAYSTRAQLVDIARRLIACVVHIDERMGLGLVRASIGIACFPEPVDDYRRLVAAADEAMYQVKRSGKNGYAFVAPATRPASS
ncbi:GGDEF domain-containing protein [Paraburkholderia sp. RL18-085-BIA-A]|uniref:GGDEF domain-containing protein n=1 Tax=Paraburkholderia sp. RL18-085-BIA-A TaxID=3031633 RepID=UPI0038BA4AF1